MNPETTANLDAARDEKCIPIARAVMADMSDKLLQETETADYKPLVLGILQKTLTADLNITMDVTYVFQLILSVLSGLNAAIQKSNPAKIDDVRYASIAKRILTIVSDANVKMGAITPEETDAEFTSVIPKLNDLFSAENLSVVEIKYVMDSIFEAFKQVNNIFSNSLADSIKRMEAKVLNIPTMDDLTMQKLNSVLVAPEVTPGPVQA